MPPTNPILPATANLIERADINFRVKGCMSLLLPSLLKLSDPFTVIALAGHLSQSGRQRKKYSRKQIIHDDKKIPRYREVKEAGGNCN